MVEYRERPGRKHTSKEMKTEVEAKTLYFENPGSENTEVVFRIVRQRAEELGIKTIVVASTRGDTTVKAVEVLSGFRVVVVGRVTGYREPDT